MNGLQRTGIAAAVFFLSLAVATVAYAYLPAGIENVIKSWFSSAGKLVKMEFYPSTAEVAKNDRCLMYVNKNTMNFELSCDGQAATVIGSASALGCVQDGAGNLLCNSFTSTDQNSHAVPGANRQRYFDNDVNLTPDPLCANYGQSGMVTIIDSTEGAADTYALCDGTTLVDYTNATIDAFAPFGFSTGGTVVPPAADDDCKCHLFNLDAPLPAVDFITMVVTTLDADDTVKIGIYNEVGTRQYFEGVLVVTSAAEVKTANALKICIGGTNADVSCAADSECPASTCVTTAPPMPRGSYWFCEGQNVEGGVSLVVLKAAPSGETQYGASFTSTTLCVAGDLPNTLAVTKTWSSTTRPYVVLSDE